MINWLIRLLAQASCEYCGKPLHQLEERRFGKVSLCEDCFKFITACNTANSMVNSMAVKTAPKMATKTAHKPQTNKRLPKLNKTATKWQPKRLTFRDLIRLFKGD